MIRRAPLLALRQSCIDRANSWLTIPRELMKKGRAKHRSALNVPLSPWARDQVAGAPDAGDAYVWPNTATGKPIRWIDHIFARASARIGVEFSCHDLRTTGASWLADAHVDELMISILLGDRSHFDAGRGAHHFHAGNVTRGYTKVFTEALRGAVNAFDDIRHRVTRWPHHGCRSAAANDARPTKTAADG